MGPGGVMDLGNIQRDIQETAERIERLKKILEEQPDDVATKRLLGRALKTMRQLCFLEATMRKPEPEPCGCADDDEETLAVAEIKLEYGSGKSWRTGYRSVVWEPVCDTCLQLAREIDPDVQVRRPYG